MRFSHWAPGVVALVASASSAWAQCSATWTAPISGGPSARFGAAMSRFVPSTQTSFPKPILLFGGMDAATKFGDTWIWDGSAWTQEIPLSAPSARSRHTLNWDLANNRILLFGGQLLNTGPSDELWSWSPLTRQWGQINVTGAPPARYAHAAAYDQARRKLVIFGGYVLGNTTTNDTWEFDVASASWAQVASSGPSPRGYASMAYDPIRGVTVLYGGEPTLTDTWEWNGCTWRLVPVPGTPDGGALGMDYDTSRQMIVIAGGNAGDAFGFDGRSWIGLTSGAHPARFESCSAYDPDHQEFLSFGGYNFNPFDELRRLTIAPLAITQHPASGTHVQGSNVPLTCVATGPNIGAYIWRKNGVATGQFGSTITLSNIQPADAGAYDCVILAGSCGTVRSDPAGILVTPTCIADVDDGSGTGTPDGGVGIEDLLYYLAQFEAGC